MPTRAARHRPKFAPKPMKRGIDRRPGARQRGYNSDYEALREVVIAREKSCRICGAACADDDPVDHIIPIRYGGKNEMSNLQRACRKCNTKKMFCDKWKYEGKK